MTVPEIVFKMVPLVLEGVEGLIFDFPASASAAHNGEHIPGVKGQIGDPAEVLNLIALDFPVLQKIDPYIWVGGIQPPLVHKVKPMNDPLGSLLIMLGLTQLLLGFDLRKQAGMIPFFDPQDEAAAMLTQRPDMRRIGT